ncbi:MAG: hypothetical protein C0594_14650, partial [Marinilabiliales bacterium]
MKKLVSIIVIGVVLFYVEASAQEGDTISRYYDNGVLQSHGYLENGSEWGRWKYYNYKGDLIQETDFFDGSLSGALIYYFYNGLKKSEGHFLLGVQHGKFEEWYENGKMKTSGKYNKGVADSVWTYYYENGKPFKQENIEDSASTVLLMNLWDEKENQLIKNGTGKYEENYTNGQLKEEGAYRNYMKVGSWRGFYSDGQKMFEGEYK